MKYFTKKWYDAMQKRSCPIHLQISDEVTDFDDKIFSKLYKEQEKEYLKKTKSYSNNTKIKLPSFNELYQINLEILKDELPASILDDISDIRVLALGYVTKDNYEKIKQFYENNAQ